MKRIILTGLLCLSVMGAFAQAKPATSPAGQATAATASPSASATAQTNPVDETTMVIPDNPQASASTASNGSGFGLWDLVRMVIILALVVAAIYGVFYVIKRGSGQKKITETALIKLLGSQGLPGNRWLHLVNVQKQVFLIGSSDDSVNLIAEITDQESIDELRFQAQTEAQTNHKTFAELIGGFFGGQAGAGGAVTGNPDGAKPGTGGAPLDFIRRQRDRLKKL